MDCSCAQCLLRNRQLYGDRKIVSNIPTDFNLDHVPHTIEDGVIHKLDGGYYNNINNINNHVRRHLGRCYNGCGCIPTNRCLNPCSRTNSCDSGILSNLSSFVSPALLLTALGSGNLLSGLTRTESYANITHSQPRTLELSSNYNENTNIASDGYIKVKKNMKIDISLGNFKIQNAGNYEVGFTVTGQIANTIQDLYNPICIAIKNNGSTGTTIKEVVQTYMIEEGFSFTLSCNNLPCNFKNGDSIQLFIKADPHAESNTHVSVTITQFNFNIKLIETCK